MAALRLGVPNAAGNARREQSYRDGAGSGWYIRADADNWRGILGRRTVMDFRSSSDVAVCIGGGRLITDVKYPTWTPENPLRTCPEIIESNGAIIHAGAAAMLLNSREALSSYLGRARTGTRPSRAR